LLNFNVDLRSHSDVLFSIKKKQVKQVRQLRASHAHSGGGGGGGGGHATASPQEAARLVADVRATVRDVAGALQR